MVFPNDRGKVDSYLGILERGYVPIQLAARVTERRKDGPAAKYELRALRHACARSSGSKEKCSIRNGFNR